jgi:hypothetical protein
VPRSVELADEESERVRLGLIWFTPGRSHADSDLDSDSDSLSRGTVSFARVLGMFVRRTAVSYHTS